MYDPLSHLYVMQTSLLFNGVAVPHATLMCNLSWAFLDSQHLLKEQVATAAKKVFVQGSACVPVPSIPELEKSSDSHSYVGHSLIWIILMQSTQASFEDHSESTVGLDQNKAEKWTVDGCIVVCAHALLLHELHQLPFDFQVQFKMPVTTYEALNGLMLAT